MWRAFAYDAAPVSDPEALGFSSSRLARIAAWQQAQVDAGAFSGAVAAIARNGKVAYLRAVGFRDRAKTIPLQPDAIFWIASMTKPVTSVAAMMLVEEGKLDLAAPVHQYLPEFKDMMVGVETTDPASGQSRLALEPQKRPMTVEDLLRHTSGLVYGDGGNTAVHKLYRESGLYDTGLARDGTLKDFVSRLARLPLAHQPGEVWEYGHSADVLGRVIEVASGQPLDQFLDSRLFKPLGMVDTGFWVPPEKLARLIDPPAGAQDSSGSRRHQADDAVLGRRRAGVDGRGLSAVLPDAAQRWRARRGAHPFARNRPSDDDERAAARSIRLRPDGSTFGLGFGDPQRCRVEHGARIGRQLLLGRGLGHLFLGRPGGAADRHTADPGCARQGSASSRSAFRNLTYGAFLVPDRGAPVSANARGDRSSGARGLRRNLQVRLRPARATSKSARSAASASRSRCRMVSSRSCLRSAARLPPGLASWPMTSSRISTTRRRKA